MNILIFYAFTNNRCPSSIIYSIISEILHLSIRELFYMPKVDSKCITYFRIFAYLTTLQNAILSLIPFKISLQKIALKSLKRSSRKCKSVIFIHPFVFPLMHFGIDIKIVLKSCNIESGTWTKMLILFRYTHNPFFLHFWVKYSIQLFHNNS